MKKESLEYALISSVYAITFDNLNALLAEYDVLEHVFIQVYIDK